MNPKELSQHFVQFVMIQAQNILLMLGKLPTPDGEMYPPNFESAKMLIEQLEMIQEKTKGNLSPQESGLLDKALSQVKMAFIESTGGTPHAMIPSRPMRGMPSLDEMEADSDEEAMSEEAPSPASSPQPPPKPVAPTPSVAPNPTPTQSEPTESKKKFVKKYN